MVHVEEEHYAEALVEFTQAIESDRTAVQAYINRGNTLLQLECYQDALNDFDTALLFEQDNVVAISAKPRH